MTPPTVLFNQVVFNICHTLTTPPPVKPEIKEYRKLKAQKLGKTYTTLCYSTFSGEKLATSIFYGTIAKFIISSEPQIGFCQLFLPLPRSLSPPFCLIKHLLDV